MNAPVPHSTAARVVLYSRAGCHLCAVARDVVADVCAQVGAEWVEVDIDSDDRLVTAFTEQVPVTFVDGRQHDFWRVEPQRLRAALAR